MTLLRRRPGLMWSDRGCVVDDVPDYGAAPDDADDSDNADQQPATSKPQRELVVIKTVDRRISLDEQECLLAHLKGLPKKRDTLWIDNEFAGQISFKGLNRLGARIVAEALNRVGTDTTVGGVLEMSVPSIARMLDDGRRRVRQEEAGAKAEAKAKRRDPSIGPKALLRVITAAEAKAAVGYYGRGHHAEVIAAINSLRRSWLSFVNEDGETSVPVVGVAFVPKNYLVGRCRIELNPRLVRYLRLNPKARNRTVVALDSLHSVNSTRAMTLIHRLSSRRHLIADYKRPEVIEVDELRDALNMPAKRTFADWRAVWHVLRDVQADIETHTGWRYDMRTKRGPAGRVAAVAFNVTKIDKDYRKVKPLRVAG